MTTKNNQHLTSYDVLCFYFLCFDNYGWHRKTVSIDYVSPPQHLNYFLNFKINTYNIDIYIYTWFFFFVHLCMVYTCVCAYICTYACVYVRVCMYIFVCVSAYVYIYV